MLCSSRFVREFNLLLNVREDVNPATQQPTHPAQRGKNVQSIFQFLTLVLVHLPSAWRFFKLGNLLDFLPQIFDFRVIFAWFRHQSEYEFRIHIWMQLPSACGFLCFNFCSNFDEKSSILACSLMQLASACRRIDKQANKSFACFLPSILACFLMQLSSVCGFFLFNFCSNFDENHRF